VVAEELVVNLCRKKLHHLCMLMGKLRASKNRTTSTEEIATAKSSDATLHKSMPLISGIGYILKI